MLLILSESLNLRIQRFNFTNKCMRNEFNNLKLNSLVNIEMPKAYVDINAELSYNKLLYKAYF